MRLTERTFPGWTYRSESKDKLPSIAKILQIEQQRKFSPAGLCESASGTLRKRAMIDPVSLADPQRDSTPLTMAFGVPYSEHSSFFE
jgi:DNA cross-link repair 1A protein